MIFYIYLSIVFSLFAIAPDITALPLDERCYTSTNARGEGFWLHINFGRNGRATSIRYKDKSKSIPLSYFGRESIYLSEYGQRYYVDTYVETYKNKVTGKLYILDEYLPNQSTNIVFERMKDGQIFYFEECDI